ncbi:MAG: hypothetical protein P4M13_00350 [Alphaproteobacteria bacterium]|nr:hypothetical protein [Alphaproteobacteria bacterium]
MPRNSCVDIPLSILLVCAVMAAYANVYANAFLYDDNILIVHNQFLRNWDYLRDLFRTSLFAGNPDASAYYRPLQALLYLLVFQTAGLSQVAFHLLNVVLHAANACMVYKLGRKLDFKPVVVFLAALLWALHPVQTEAVTYMSATADSLYAFFCLWGAIVLLPDFTPRRMLAAALLMIFGLLSKESAISFPLLAMSCFYLMSDKRFDLKSYFRFWPLLVIAGTYVFLHFAFLPHGLAAPKVAGAVDKFGSLATLPRYLGFLLLPRHLHMEYDLPVYSDIWHADSLAGIGLAVMATIQILRERPGHSLPFSWGLCWFAAALLPSFLVNAFYYEHWLYLPSAGLFLGTAQSAALFMERHGTLKRGSVALMLLLAFGAGLLTYRQNRIWRDPVVFYTHIFAQGETAARAHVNLGVVYLERGEYEKAAAQERIAITNSNDTLATAQNNLAVALSLMPERDRRSDEIQTHLLRAVEINPDFYPALDALALFYDRQGDAAKAEIYRERVEGVRRKLRF